MSLLSSVEDFFAKVGERLAGVEAAKGVWVSNAFPVNPLPWQRVVRIDNGDEFYWDSVRGKWLGTALGQLLFSGATVANNAFLAISRAPSAEPGVRIPYPVTICEMHGNSVSTGTYNFELLVGGTTYLLVGAPSPGASLNLNLDVPAMTEIKVRISNASGTQTSVKAFVRYRRKGA